MLNISQTPVREPMTSILCHFIYINQYQYIDNIVTEELSWDTDGPRVIPSAKVLQMIQTKRYNTPNTKYIFKESCLFHVDLEPEHVQEFAAREDDAVDFRRFFRVLPPVEDIVLSDAIFLFHSVSAIYFFFQEVPLKRGSNPKSILKGGEGGEVRRTHKRADGEGRGGGGGEGDGGEVREGGGAFPKKVTIKLHPNLRPSGTATTGISGRTTRKHHQK